MAGNSAAETTPSTDPLARYRALQVASILLTSAGLAAVLGVIASDPASLVTGQLPADRDRLLGLLLVAGAGGLAVVVGVAMNAVRAIVVRAALPAARYRGPSILVLVLVATAVTTGASISLGRELLALEGDGEPTRLGTLLILTVTQLGLLVAGAAFVAVPRALAGIRFAPVTGLGRTVLIGGLLAVPAWLGATLLSLIATLVLGAFGIEPQLGLADSALDVADPVVLVLAVVVVAPIAEEIFFRGIVLNAWEREYGPRRAVYGSAALFAAIHGSIFALVPIFGLGVVLAALYRRTRSLPATITLHAVFNGLTVTIALLIRYDIISLPLPT